MSISRPLSESTQQLPNCIQYRDTHTCTETHSCKDLDLNCSCFYQLCIHKYAQTFLHHHSHYPTNPLVCVGFTVTLRVSLRGAERNLGV